MKIVFFTNQITALPLLGYFNEKGWLKAVVYPDKNVTGSHQLEEFCVFKNIPFDYIGKKELSTLVTNLFNTTEPDLAIMFGFPYRIPEYLITRSRLGFYNIHFSILPTYRGPDPVFWQIKNGESLGGVSIHRIDNDWDTGPVIIQQQIPFIPGENWGICNSRYSAVAIDLMIQLVDKLQRDEPINTIEVNKALPSYYPKPTADDLTINWEEYSAQQIENLVNAANPIYLGAGTAFQQQPLRILEVSPADGASFPDAVAGEVVHYDHSGLYIQCADRNLIRINVALFHNTFFSGFKLGMMGLQKGTKLSDASLNEHAIHT